MLRACFWVAVLAVTLLLTTASSSHAQEPPAIDKAAFDKAVNAGVEFLRKNQNRDGTWIYQKETPEFNIGATALVGIALLESGVEKNDPVLQTVLRLVRNSAPRLTKTYAIALAVMFLDRYTGEPRDGELIRTLAFRLAGGQDRKTGGWGYDCKPLNANDQLQVQNFLQRNRGPFKFGNQRPDTSHVKGLGSDNSNTQFAILALWIARRRNIPVDHPLMLAEWRFRSTQLKDGSWGYGRDGTIDQAGGPAMTCTGLLALATGFGLQKERSAELKSGGKIDQPEDLKGGPPQPSDIRIDPAVQAAKAYLATKTTNSSPMGVQHNYFLWSLERVAVVYGFVDLDGQNWHVWGTRQLLKTQKEDGSWETDNNSIADTCFALLFLKKVNLVPDLSNEISGSSNLRTDENVPAKPALPPTKPSVPLKEVTAAEAEGVAQKLGTELLTANPERQAEILDVLQNTVDRSGHFTEKLAGAIPKLQGQTKEQAREALAARLSRQTAKSLRDKLSDAKENTETRLAAARASALKEEKTLVPDLINLFSSKDDTLASAAEDALKVITQQNLGRDAERWRTWWKSQK